jgi:hypothetical protein
MAEIMLTRAGISVPVLVGVGELGLTPWDLPGRYFRVNAGWRGDLARDGLAPGARGCFVSVALDYSGDWSAVLRFIRYPGRFWFDEDLWRLLPAVELLAYRFARGRSMRLVQGSRVA